MEQCNSANVEMPMANERHGNIVNRLIGQSVIGGCANRQLGVMVIGDWSDRYQRSEDGVVRRTCNTADPSIIIKSVI